MFQLVLGNFEKIETVFYVFFFENYLNMNSFGIFVCFNLVPRVSSGTVTVFKDKLSFFVKYQY